MNKSNLRSASWILVIVSTVITLFLVYKGWLTQYQDYLYVIDGTGVIELSIIELSNKLREPTIFIDAVQIDEKIGFSIEVKDKNIGKISVLCDELPVELQKFDARTKNFEKTEELHVGADPSFIFPYWNEIDNWASVENNNQYIHLRVLRKSIDDHINSNSVFDGQYTIYRGAFKPFVGETYSLQQFQANIRIFGEGIEVPIDRFFDINFRAIFSRSTNSDDLKDISVEFRLKTSEPRFIKRRRRFRFPRTQTTFRPKVAGVKT